MPAGVPDRIGIFEVIKQLGAGGMGAVYLGRDPELDRQVAIKVIREEVRDQEVLDRFFREARAAAALRHPNIITVYASGQYEQKPYIAMEFVDGESMVDIIRERRQLSLQQKLSYIDQICAGLHFAHRAGIVHRDIKPANVMVDRDDVVRILDFGIARIEGSGMTQDGALIGSLNYMSPEQMLGGRIDHRSDIFSVGSLAYELITYQQAFKGTLNDGLLHRLPSEDPPPLHELTPGLPAAVEEVIMRALKKSPDERFQSLADMRAALGVVQSSTLGSMEERTIQIRRSDVPGASTSLDFLFEKAPDGYEQVTNTDFLGDNANALRASTDAMFNPSTPAPEPIPGPPPTNWEPPSQMFKAPPPAPEPPPPVVEARIDTPPPVPAAPTPPPSTISKPPATQVKAPSTTIAPPTAISRPPSTQTKAPVTPPVRGPVTVPPPKESSVGKWIGIAVAAVVIIGGAIVAIPRFTEQPDPVEVERPRVVETMERYRTAYRTKNLAGVTAVFPGLPQNLRASMQRNFERCVLYEVRFAEMQVDLNPEATQAKVDLRSEHECTLSNAPLTTTREHVVFTLQRQGEDWSISNREPVR